MCFLKNIHSNQVFETLIQTFYIALSHISIRTRDSKCLRAVFMIKVSFCGWSFRLWSLHIWYIIMGDTCYIPFLALLQSPCQNLYVCFELLR